MTDEIIEAVARAIYEKRYGPDYIPWIQIEKDRFRKEAKAALAVARPLILEEAAKIADEIREAASMTDEICDDGYGAGAKYAAETIVRDIREQAKGETP